MLILAVTSETTKGSKAATGMTITEADSKAAIKATREADSKEEATTEATERMNRTIHRKARKQNKETSSSKTKPRTNELHTFVLGRKNHPNVHLG